MMKQPIMVFKNEKQLRKCLKYWKKKLFLTDWTIQVQICPPDEIKGLAGRNNFTFEDKSSIIRIGDYSLEDRKNYVGKTCDECTLVHELLHLKYNFVENSDSFEGKYYEAIEHQKLEQLAKTLIMVKYDLPFKWFQNF